VIKTNAKEAMSRTVQREVGNVLVKYVLVSPEGGRWRLSEKDWRTCEGDVYYQRVEDVYDQRWQ
jgi:hypothetical protein